VEALLTNVKPKCLYHGIFFNILAGTWEKAYEELNPVVAVGIVYFFDILYYA
jgi:hypothetical protein